MSVPLNGTMRYRPYLDGLRGLAIIAVVFYHSQIPGFGGGFVGVDIFFVVSGFLITSLALPEIRSGTFSPLRFWARRVRRILPALFVLTLATLIAGYFLVLYPNDYSLLANAAIAQSIFSSNMLFAFSDSYFDKASQFSPLLHTWTLSVEAQFYLLFPCVVACGVWLQGSLYKTRWRSAARSLPLIGISAIGILSFLLSVWCTNLAGPSTLVFTGWNGVPLQSTFATIGYYLLFTRAWELALGAALVVADTHIRSRAVAEALSYTGLIAIGSAVFFYTDLIPFPGLAALLPTIGAALIVVASENQGTTVRSLLSAAPIIWLGVLSYSFYLWHWPILVYAHILYPEGLSSATTAVLLAIMLALSWLSFTLIETPFRKIRVDAETTIVFAVCALAALFVAGSVFGATISDLHARTPQTAEALLRARRSISDLDICALNGNEQKIDSQCALGDTDPQLKTSFVVWGDSQAASYAPLFNALGKALHVRGVDLTANACVPEPPGTNVSFSPDCDQLNTTALAYIKANDIRYIFLINNWNRHIAPSDPLTAGLISLLTSLQKQGREIYIVKQIPDEPILDPSMAFYMTIRPSGETLPGVDTVSAERDSSFSDSVLDPFGKLAGVHVIDPLTFLCKEHGTCQIWGGGYLLYLDDHHLSYPGAMELAPLFSAQMATFK